MQVRQKLALVSHSNGRQHDTVHTRPAAQGVAAEEELAYVGPLGRATETGKERLIRVLRECGTGV